MAVSSPRRNRHPLREALRPLRRRGRLPADRYRLEGTRLQSQPRRPCTYPQGNRQDPRLDRRRRLRQIGRVRQGIPGILPRPPHRRPGGTRRGRHRLLDRHRNTLPLASGEKLDIKGPGTKDGTPSLRRRAEFLLKYIPENITLRSYTCQ